jgi:cytochrome b6-f complex iron-sulfur subunit
MPSLLAAALLTSWDELGIGVAASVFAVVVVLLLARRRGGRAGSAAGASGGGLPVTRRTFLERGVLGLFAASLAGVATSAVDYVATALSARQGKSYTLGAAEQLRRHLAAGTPYYDPVGGFYVVAYPEVDLTAAREAYTGDELAAMEHGFVALDQACTHLGCRVPFCPTSKWFECPCHGSRYNGVGEQRRGPAPRGLDRYELTVVDGQVVVDTRHKTLGPPPGTDTTGQAPAGPHCY